MVNRWIVVCATAALIAAATVDTALAQERRQRTEAGARAAAERNRAERARQEAETGRPVALIHDYVLATVGPVPESLDVDPRHYATTNRNEYWAEGVHGGSK